MLVWLATATGTSICGTGVELVLSALSDEEDCTEVVGALALGEEEAFLDPEVSAELDAFSEMKTSSEQDAPS